MAIQALNTCQTRLNRLQCLSGNQIKLIAAALMLVDHLSKIVFVAAINALAPLEQSGQLASGTAMGLYDFCRSVLYPIGAISFPIFCFMFADGYHYTKSKVRFVLRLFLFALISEIPFDLAFFSKTARAVGTFPFHWGHQNVFFTFLMGVCALAAIDKLRTVGNTPLSLCLQACAVYFIGKLAGVLHCDYGTYGVFLIVVFYLFRGSRLLQILGALILRFLVFYYRSYPFSFLAAVFIILLYNGQRGKLRMKYFFYIFYPTHIFAAYLIRMLIQQL